MTARRIVLWFLAQLLVPSALRAQGSSCTAIGADRWAVKTMAPAAGVPRALTLAEIAALPVPTTVSAGARGVAHLEGRYLEAVPADSLREGQLVTVTGWVRLVKVSADDCDLHIQMTPERAAPDPMIIVEIPRPDRKHVHDAALRALLAIARDSLRAAVKAAGLPQLLTITGALFFDTSHFPDCANRGVGGMHAASCWEIHPVIAVTRP